MRDNPYGAFNYQVSLGGAGESEASVVAGFSDVTGLGNELNYSEYRNGNEKFNTVRKVPNTLQERRCDPQARPDRLGPTSSSGSSACATAYQPRPVTITLLDEARQPVATFRLCATPSRRSGSVPRWRPRAAARSRWRSCTWYTKASNIDKPWPL